jgi:hypothetical protein
MTTHDYTVTYQDHYYVMYAISDDGTLVNLRVIGQDVSVGDLLTLQGGFQYRVIQIDSIIDNNYVLIAELVDDDE